MLTRQASGPEVGSQNQQKKSLKGWHTFAISEQVRQRLAGPWGSQVTWPSLNWQIPGQR